MSSQQQWLILCEHSSHSLPKWAKPYYTKEALKLLDSHFGWDQGTPELAKILVRGLGATAHFGEHSRLLIDLNRSLESKSLWTPWSKFMPEKLKERAIKKYYWPYRQAARESLLHLREKGPTLIYALHSFTPSWKGKRRKTDIGLLFSHDSSRERKLAERVRKELIHHLPDWNIHFNLPYRGFTDCFLNDLLRENKSQKDVNGLFIELNQSRVSTMAQRRRLGEVLRKSFLAVRV